MIIVEETVMVLYHLLIDNVRINPIRIVILIVSFVMLFEDTTSIEIFITSVVYDACIRK